MLENVSHGLHFRSSKPRNENVVTNLQKHFVNINNKDHDTKKDCILYVSRRICTRRDRYLRMAAIVLCVVVFHLIVCLTTMTISRNQKFYEKRHRLDNEYSHEKVRVELFQEWSSVAADIKSNITSHSERDNNYHISPPSIARDLIEREFYNPYDFWNNRTFVPLWWDVSTTTMATKTSHEAALFDDKGHIKDNHPPLRWGPCFPPYNETEIWTYTRQLSTESNLSTRNNTQATQKRFWPSECHVSGKDAATRNKKDRQNGSSFISSSLDGKCLPGFLIIGAGKSGTSSLYHYLTEHPRIAPARQKQVGYFKYFADRGLGCYLSFFPSFHEFMSSGALITGEAFPGYLPYPDVASRIKQTFEDDNVNNDQNAYPKIIVTVREPLSRAYSSYKYNYLEPALAKLRTGKFSNVPANKSEEYYMQHHIFSFEELIRAELMFLRKCLSPRGWAQRRSLQKQRELLPNKVQGSSRPLVDIEVCYESDISMGDGSSVNLRNTDETEQKYKLKSSRPLTSGHVQELMLAHPKKIIYIPKNNHLIQSMIGRSLYALALEWWYELFHGAGTYNSDRIYVICMEDMSTSTEALDNVTSFLGLPPYNNFVSAINRGHYNVGSISSSKRRQNGTPFLQEYDTPVAVESTSVHAAHDNETLTGSHVRIRKGKLNSLNDGKHELPLPADLLHEMKDFFSTYNERMFQLIGRRCAW